MDTSQLFETVTLHNQIFRLIENICILSFEEHQVFVGERLQMYICKLMLKKKQTRLFQTIYYQLPNTNPWARTGDGIPSHGFLLSHVFSLFPTLGYNPALGFLFFPPLAVIQPQVFHFSPSWLLFRPWFSTFTHPWLRSLFFLALFIPYPTLGFSLGYYSALGFFFYQPLVIILPLDFSSSHPWLLFNPRFSPFPILGYYSPLGFPLLPTLGYYLALGLYSAGESDYKLDTLDFVFGKTLPFQRVLKKSWE